MKEPAKKMSELERNRAYENADEHLGRLLLKEDPPWYRTFFRNVKEAISPPKLPPLEVTSKPVAVKDIWGFYGGYKRRAGAYSVLIHVSVVALMFTLATNRHVQDAVKQTAISLISPDLAPYIPQKPNEKQMGGGGGGGWHST